MDALELALRCSSLLMPVAAISSQDSDQPDSSATDLSTSHNDELNDSDREDHFKGRRGLF